jgi:NAD(P)H-dependent FMN reductase
MKIAIIYGSVRSHRQGIKAAKFITNKVKERGHEVKLIDPLEYKLPMLDKMYKEYEKGKAPAPIEQVARILEKADAFITVTGEYNHGIPPALKNLLDHFQKEYFFKPSAIASYSGGPFGGIRAAMQLRPVLAELGTPSIPTTFPISAVRSSFDEQGKALDEAYNRRITKFLDELEWYANALKEARERGTPY